MLVRLKVTNEVAIICHSDWGKLDQAALVVGEFYIEKEHISSVQSAFQISLSNTSNTPLSKQVRELSPTHSRSRYRKQILGEQAFKVITVTVDHISC